MMTMLKRPHRRTNLVLIKNFVKRLVEQKEPSIEELRKAGKALACT